jgi:hypothetical protein
MDSLKYYLAKLFYEIYNTNEYKFNDLNSFNREVVFPSENKYYGKYYDYIFNKRYFGIYGLNKYNELTNIETDTVYVISNVINKLYSDAMNNNIINKLVSNNIFKYTVSINTKGYESTNLLKESNTYTIDIKDNYNHLVDPTIDNIYINTNSLDFSTNEMIQSTDVSILSKEPYKIVSKIDYGYMLLIFTESLSFNSNYTFTLSGKPMIIIDTTNSEINYYTVAYDLTLYTEEILYYVRLPNSQTFQIYIRPNINRYTRIIIDRRTFALTFQGLHTINLPNIGDTVLERYQFSTQLVTKLLNTYEFISVSNNGKVSDKVVVKSRFYNYSNNRTYITFSSNYNFQLNLIEIMNNTLQIKYDEIENSYYMDYMVNIVKNQVYTVFKPLSIGIQSIQGYYQISDIILDRDINPFSYIQRSDPIYFYNTIFSIDNYDIFKINVLTPNKIRIQYKIIDNTKPFTSILYHNYKLNESTPNFINSITPVSKYYYTVPNTYKITLNNTIKFNSLYIKTTVTTYTKETTTQITDYEDIQPEVTDTVTYSVTTKEVVTDNNEEISNNTISARYVRFNRPDVPDGLNKLLTIAEFKIYDNNDDQILINVSQITVEPLYRPEFNGDKMIDNNDVTFSSTTDTIGAYIEVDLLEDKLIGKIEITNRVRLQDRIVGTTLKLINNNTDTIYTYLFEEAASNYTIIPSTNSTIITTITRDWINKGCHWDGGHGAHNYPDPPPAGATPGETYIRTINGTYIYITSLDEAIVYANDIFSNVFGIQAGGALFMNNTFTTSWPYRYDEFDEVDGLPLQCSELGDTWSNHVYTLKKTTSTVTNLTTTEITYTPLNTYIYNVDNNEILFYTDEYSLTETLNTADMIITKDYDLTIISYVDTVMVTYIPPNIVNANCIYKIVDKSVNPPVVYSATVIFENNLIITTSASIPTNNIKLRQIITDTNHNIIPKENNQEYTISTDDSIYNYSDMLYYNKSPYFIPVIQFLNVNSELKEMNDTYYYKFNFLGEWTLSGPARIGNFSYIYVYYNDVYVKADVLIISNNVVIIGTNNYIQPSLLNIYSADLIDTLRVNILNYYYPYFKGTILEQIDNYSFKMLLPMNSVFNISNYSQYILTFRYSEMNLINNTYPLVGFNKVPDIITTTTTNTTNYHDIEWVKNLGIKLFKSIEVSIDDNIVEKINPDIYTIFSYYFMNMYKRGDLDDLINTTKNSDGSIMLHLPIPFFFSLTEDTYLPISCMNRSTIKIKFVLDKINNLISNNISNKYTVNVNPNIDFNYSFIYTDDKILNRFKKTNLLISPFYYYQNFLLNKLEEYNHVSLFNRTIELFFITSTKNDTLKYSETIIKDNWYIRYLSNNPNDATIFNIVDAEIQANSTRYNVMKTHPVIKNYSARFAMYLDTKYLNYINEDLNNISLKYAYKLTVLVLYFTNIYKNETKYTVQQIIDTLNIFINGKELLPSLASTYHNSVVSYQKGIALPDGYHAYGFNFDSLASQPNGFVNMKKINDLLIYSKQNDVNQEYKLKVCTREYKILQIDNSKGKLI